MNSGDGVAKDMASTNWRQHSLGSPDAWPPLLKSLVSTIMASPQAMFLAWGPELHFFFNDAYRPILGKRADGALGRRFQDLWADEWQDLEPIVNQALSGEGASFEDWPLQVTRNGVPEQTWWTFSYMPIRDDRDQTVGMWCVTNEVTAAVVATRAAAVERDRQKQSLQQMPGFMAIIAGPKHVFEYVNDAYVTIAGDRDYIGRELRQVLPDLEGQGFYELLDHTYATGEPFSAKAAPLRLAGVDHELFVDLHYAAIRDQDGKITGIFIGGHDVTESYEAHLALQTLNADLERQVAERTSERGKTWEISPFLLAVSDRTSGIFLRVNPAWTKVMGWCSEEIVGHSFLDFLHPDDVSGTSQCLADLQAGKPILNYENRYRDKDGAYRWFSWVTVPEDDRLYSTVRDVTDEKAAAAERDRLWTYAADMLARADYTGMMTAVNPAWTRVLGFTEGELLTRPYADFMHDDDTDVTLAALQRMGETGAPTRFENRILTTSGDYKPIDWTVVPEPDGQNFIAIGRDLSQDKAREQELLHTQEALRQSQKMEAVGQLTGGIAHDFNNLLAGIAGSLELMQKRINEQGLAGFDRHLGIAQASTQRAAALTQRLLAFSRRQTLDPKPIDVNRLVTGLEDLFRRSVDPKIEVAFVGAVGLWPIKADAPQLENALLNLVINARDAMPDGGRITIETANVSIDGRVGKERDLAPGQYISLCVTDTGTGMPPDVVERVFDPFFTTKPLGQGTGLGLSMIHGYVRQSGGQVRVYSEVGQGTTMCLYLPRYAGPLEGVQETEEDAAIEQGQGETVLVIDDEEPIRMLISDVLEDAGYRVLDAADGPSGLKMLESETRIDLLITDVGLPGGFNGRQVADAARQTRPTLKVLFVTGYAENAAVGNGHLEPGMQLITKPFQMSALALRVREIIES